MGFVLNSRSVRFMMMKRCIEKLRKRGVWSALVVLALLAVPGLVSAAQNGKGDLVSIGKVDNSTQPPLVVTLGKADLIDVDGAVADVLVADPSVIDVMAVQSNRLYVVGLSVGDTNIIALDAQGDVVKRLDVHVTYDLQAIQSLVERLFPDEDVTIGSIHDQIVLTGSVSNSDVASRVANIVGHYVSDLQDEEGAVDELISNVLEVRGEQQVMLQVKIVEASRTILKELGVETNFNDTNELSATTIFGGRPNISNFGAASQADPASLTLGSAIGLSQDPIASARLLADSGISGIGTLGIFLNALEEENLVNILAEPNLTAVSGEQAGFLAGGEFPVPVGRDQVGNLIIEFREFGVSLNFRPIVMSDSRISLQLNTEVSSLDFESAIVLADLTVPGLDIRRADTTVEIASGASLMIAGLLQSEAVEGMQGLPGISKAPVLGDLVSSDSFQRDESELVVIVTPVLVEPYEEKERAEPAPTDKTNPLAASFAMNIRRAYDLTDNDMFGKGEAYGYLLD